MTTTSAAVGDRALGDLPSPVLAGVDGSRQSRSAALWAAAEAEGRHQPLHLVGACPVPTTWAAGDALGTGPYPTSEVEEYTRENLSRMVTAMHTSAEVRLVVAAGSAAAFLLATVTDLQAGLLVVGRRGRGAVRRTFLGSTSTAVAGRCGVPVVVVPDGWVPNQLASAPVVVGIDTSDAHATVLGFAFERAQRLRVPLVAVHAAAGSIAGEDHLTAALAAWRRRYVEVEVAARVVDASPADAVLDASNDAQLLVLGRRPRRHLDLGLRLGSTAPEVLHRAHVPVAVVPTVT